MPKRQISQKSLNNLIPQAHVLTDEDRAKGKQVQRERRSAQAAINRILSCKLTPKQIKQYESMGNTVTGDETVIDLLMAGQARAAVDGSEKCARLILEYAGERSSINNAEGLISLLELIQGTRQKDAEE